MQKIKILHPVKETYEGCPQWEIEFPDNSRGYVTQEEIGWLNNEVTWRCPYCEAENVDLPAWTAVPICEACERKMKWSEILEIPHA